MASERVRSYCDRCTELGIIDTISQWPWKGTTIVQDPNVLQRVLFDIDYPLLESCRTCRRASKFLSCRRVHFVPVSIVLEQIQSESYPTKHIFSI